MTAAIDCGRTFCQRAEAWRLYSVSSSMSQQSTHSLARTTSDLERGETNHSGPVGDSRILDGCCVLSRGFGQKPWCNGRKHYLSIALPIHAMKQVFISKLSEVLHSAK